MDSMKSLNTSLPRSYPRRQPTTDLHQAFKAAALSVAQLYKTAAADEDHSRAAGYQDALEELLSFLDQENLGVGDGEGWRVRQWVTERLSPEAYGSGDEEAENMNDQPTSPEPQRRLEQQNSIHLLETHHQRSSSAPAPELQQPEHRQQQETPSVQPEQQLLDRSGTFTFRSSLQPSEDAMMLNNDKPSNRTTLTTSSRHFRHRSIAHGMRDTSSSAGTTLGAGAGNKRRAQSGDIFDFSIFDSLRDSSSGGGKRTRFA